MHGHVLSQQGYKLEHLARQWSLQHLGLHSLGKQLTEEATEVCKIMHGNDIMGLLWRRWEDLKGVDSEIRPWR